MKISTIISGSPTAESMGTVIEGVVAAAIKEHQLSPSIDITVEVTIFTDISQCAVQCALSTGKYGFELKAWSTTAPNYAATFTKTIDADIPF